MAIVKKQQKQLLKPMAQQSPTLGVFVDPNLGTMSYHADTNTQQDNFLDYNEATVQAGLVPERRKTRADDRRQFFRRNEDQFLLSRAELEAEQIKEEARQEGFETGLNQSLEAITELKQVLNQIFSARDEALGNASNEIADIAIEVVKHILKAEISCDAALIESFVRKAIKQAGHHHKTMTVRVHPDNYQELGLAFETHSPVGADVDFQLLEDKTVDLGSCIIETEAGQVDRRFSTQLAVLKRLMQTTVHTSNPDDGDDLNMGERLL